MQREPIKYSYCDSFRCAMKQHTRVPAFEPSASSRGRNIQITSYLSALKAYDAGICGMTLIIPLVNHRSSFGMEDQCLVDGDTYTVDDIWGNSSAEIGFLCNGVMEEDIYTVNGKGIKRKDLCDGNTLLDSDFSLNEQRRVIIQVSFEKLRQLEDPESSLRRSVLINNTLKLLHGQVNSDRRPYSFGERVNSLNFTEDVDRSRKRFRVSTENTCKANINKDQITEDYIDQNCVTTSRERCILPQTLKDELEDDVFEPALPNGTESEHRSDRESIFGEFDSVFHSFICALDG